MIHLYIQLFWSFFKIGLFGFGGGYAIVSMIQNEVVTRHAWLTASEFTDIVAISQSTPGPISINSATYVGYASLVDAGYAPAWGVLGSAIATVAIILPSLLLLLAICRYFMRYAHHPAVENVFSALRPAVIGLIAAAALLLMTEENFGSPTASAPQFIFSIIVFALTLIGQLFFRISPIKLLCLGGVCGLIFF